ncbi:unnamed protein product [Blepharisma stoltei]|uniref:Uncharacterized protein n=1 Tax=Blepharisma stoltei TaxID=1481888 RepID=A0AAU9K189_9CILI|nr:unnamed protein product [Blepharisma stoltei]
MRRTCRFGVYSSGTIKRCPKKYCCKCDVSQTLKMIEQRYFRRGPLEIRPKLSKRLLHLYFVGRDFFGKRKVTYNQKYHRRSKKSYSNYEMYCSALGKNDLIDLNIEEAEIMIDLFKSEYPEKSYSLMD